MSGVKLILTTFSKEEEAADVVRALVRENLIACGTLFNAARSIYLWEGSIEDNEEVVVLMKTALVNYNAFHERLLAIHPYDTPEIIAIDPADVSPKYAAWIASVCPQP